jgi:hypothetical protein
MHAAFRRAGSAHGDRGIPGTFYPSDGPMGGRSIGSALPKLVAVLVAMAFVRNLIAAKRHGAGGSRWSRRREAIAEFHRELHAADAAEAEAPTKA